MAENLIKVPVKGILKNSSSFEGSGSHKCHPARATKWDEMNILATHHPPDKDYGHMKIEEPKTPYSYNNGEESGDEGDGAAPVLDSDLLAEKLKEKKSFPAESMDNEEDDSDEEFENETPEERAKRKSFESKRKAHYNEFMAVKLARQLMEREEDEEDGEDDAKDGEGDERNADEVDQAMETREAGME